MTGSGKFWTWALTGALTLLIVVVVNLFIDEVSGQWDLTEDDRYTLPPAAVSIVERLEDVCTIKCYVTTKLPSALGHVPRVLRTRLEEFRTASHNRIEFRFIDPEEDTNPEEFKAELQSRGIQAKRIPHVDEGKQVVGDYFMALEFTYLDQEEQLDLVQTVGRTLLFESEMLRALPYALCSKFVKMMNPESQLGIVSDKKIPPKELQQPQGPFGAEATDLLTGLRGAITSNLAAPKDVVVNTGAPVPDDLSALLVYRPDNLSERAVYEIDQALMKGKSVALMLDNYASIELDRFIKDYFQQIQQKGNGRIKVRELSNEPLIKWLAHFGVNVGKGYVESLSCGVRQNMTLQIVNGRPVPVPQRQRYPAVIMVNERDKDGPTGQFSDSDPAFSGLGQVSMFAPAPLSLDTSVLDKNHADAKADIVLSTHEESFVREAVGGWMNIYEKPGVDTPTDRRSFPLVISVRGSFKSYFAGKTYGADDKMDRPPLKAADGSDRPAGPNEELKLDESIEPGQLWVFADADFCNDAYLMQRIGLAQATGIPQALQGAQRLVAGFMNVVNNLTSGKELVEIRKPSVTDRSINTERVEEDKGSIRFKSVWLMPLIVVGFGLAWWLARSVATRVPTPMPRSVTSVGGTAGFAPIEDVPSPSPAEPDEAYAPAGEDDVTTQETKPEEPQS